VLSDAKMAGDRSGGKFTNPGPVRKQSQASGVRKWVKIGHYPPEVLAILRRENCMFSRA